MLGPILFLVYIDDLEEGVTGNILKFADDTKLFRKTKEIGDKQTLQDDIDKLVRWSEKWHMLFNVGKCKCLHTGPGNTGMNYEMGGTILNKTGKECGLTTLETRRLRGDQIEVFKILNGYANIDSNIFFEIKKSKITRGHNFTLVKKQSRLDVRKYSFSQRTINVWNKLSTDCVHATSVNVFKNRIDKYLVKAGYT